MKYLAITCAATSVLFLTQCVSSYGEVCLFGMKSGTGYLENTWGTSDRVPLSSSELKKQTEIAQQKVDENVNKIYGAADLYCANRDGFFPDEQTKNQMIELATIQLDKGFAVGNQNKALEYALKEDATSLLLATLFETAGIYKKQLIDYCDNNRRAKVPGLFQRGYFFHYMQEQGYIWFAPEKSARFCKTILG